MLLMFVRYLRAELKVRTRGIHDYLLRDSALITDPEGEADYAPEFLWGNNMSRLHHLLHWFPEGWSLAWFISMQWDPIKNNNFFK